LVEKALISLRIGDDTENFEPNLYFFCFLLFPTVLQNMICIACYSELGWGIFYHPSFKLSREKERDKKSEEKDKGERRRVV
jgi:hypothetical protein